MADENAQENKRRTSLLAYFLVELFTYTLVFIALVSILARYGLLSRGAGSFAIIFLGTAVVGLAISRGFYKLFGWQKPRKTGAIDTVLFLLIPLATFLISGAVISKSINHYYSTHKSLQYSGGVLNWYGYKTATGSTCYLTALGANLDGDLVAATACTGDSDNSLSVFNPTTKTDYAIFYKKRFDSKGNSLSCVDFSHLDVGQSNKVDSNAIIYLFYQDYSKGAVQSDEVESVFGMSCFPENLASLISAWLR